MLPRLSRRRPPMVLDLHPRCYFDTRFTFLLHVLESSFIIDEYRV